MIETLGGSCGIIYSFVIEDTDFDEFTNFMNKYIQYLDDPLLTAYKLVHSALTTMLEETGFQRSFFKDYDEFNVSRLRKTNELRLYVCRFSDEEIIIGSGGKKLGGKRPFQSSPILYKCVKILSALQEQIRIRMKENNVGSIKELLNLKEDFSLFTIQYEDETQ